MRGAVQYKWPAGVHLIGVRWSSQQSLAGSAPPPRTRTGDVLGFAAPRRHPEPRPVTFPELAYAPTA
jgi:hypothetical protein